MSGGDMSPQVLLIKWYSGKTHFGHGELFSIPDFPFKLDLTWLFSPYLSAKLQLIITDFYHVYYRVVLGPSVNLKLIKDTQLPPLLTWLFTFPSPFSFHPSICPSVFPQFENTSRWRGSALLDARWSKRQRSTGKSDGGREGERGKPKCTPAVMAQRCSLLWPVIRQQWPLSLSCWWKIMCIFFFPPNLWPCSQWTMMRNHLMFFFVCPHFLLTQIFPILKDCRAAVSHSPQIEFKTYCHNSLPVSFCEATAWMHSIEKTWEGCCSLLWRLPLSPCRPKIKSYTLHNIAQWVNINHGSVLSSDSVRGNISTCSRSLPGYCGCYGSTPYAFCVCKRLSSWRVYLPWEAVDNSILDTANCEQPGDAAPPAFVLSAFSLLDFWQPLSLCACGCVCLCLYVCECWYVSVCMLVWGGKDHASRQAKGCRDLWKRAR